MKAIGVMDFAGGFAVGVSQAGFDYDQKREPDAFGGFGIEAVQRNFPRVSAQVAPPKDWELVDGYELVFGCPPCAGFSQLSAANNTIHAGTGKNYRGADADINECMTWLVEYAAKVRPQVLILESVQAAYKIGRSWMESLWERLRDESGVDYRLTHVLMNAAIVGGDVIRPRYFMVASTVPFGVGMEYVKPRTFREVVGDLPDQTDDADLDWGHMTTGSPSSRRIRETILWLERQGREWRPGTRLPDNNEGLEIPEWWLKNGKELSHWHSTDMFSPFRWRPDDPFGVITGGSLDRAVNAIHPRTLTYREAARLVSLPDDWSLEPIVRRRAGPELGKAVTGAAGKWIAHWARMAIEGTPGEYAGLPLAPGVRVVDVTDTKRVLRALNEDVAEPAWWTGIVPTSDPSPDRWLIDRRSRPASWAGPTTTTAPDRQARPQRPKQSTVAQPRADITRIAPETFQALLDELGISRAQAANALGVSTSRVAELTGHNRPGSWLNSTRWPEVQEALRTYTP